MESRIPIELCSSRGYEMSVLFFGKFTCVKIRIENTVAMLARESANVVCQQHCSKEYTTLHVEGKMKMVERGDHVRAFKGAHQGKFGVIEKVHRVFVSIRFSDGSHGKTLPSFVTITVPSVEVIEEDKEEDTAFLRRSRNLEEYRSTSVEMLAEMLAQGLALSNRSEEDLKKELNALQVRVGEIRQGR
jgi:hypothetical protein